MRWSLKHLFWLLIWTAFIILKHNFVFIEKSKYTKLYLDKKWFLIAVSISLAQTHAYAHARTHYCAHMPSLSLTHTHARTHTRTMSVKLDTLKTTIIEKLIKIHEPDF